MPLADDVAEAGVARDLPGDLDPGPLPEPGVLAGVGVTRVQISTASGSGSPEATPCRKYDGADGGRPGSGDGEAGGTDGCGAEHGAAMSADRISGERRGHASVNDRGVLT